VAAPIKKDGLDPGFAGPGPNMSFKSKEAPKKVLPWNPDIKKPKLNAKGAALMKECAMKLAKKVNKSENDTIDLAKAFEDRWLLEFGDRFKKMATENNLPFTFKPTSSGSRRDYIFKIGDCTVTYSEMGGMAKVRFDKTSEKGEKIAKALYYGIQRAHEP
jgi:hypothetical protein